MQSLLPVLWMIVPLVLDCPATSSFPRLRDDIVDGYNAVDEFSVAYFLVANEIYDGEATLCLGSIAYRYDRSERTLAIGIEGDAILIVQGNRAFILLWQDEHERKTFLEFSRSNAIGWNDIDEALRLIKKECPLSGPRWYLPHPVLPFLHGGVEQLFRGNTRVLSQDDQDAEAIYGAGHPDTRLMIGLAPKQPKLDPHKFPHCIRTENALSDWQIAFDQETGLVAAAIGVVPRMQVLGVPGNSVEVFLKQVVRYHEGQNSREFPEVSLQLPKHARTIAVEDLRIAYQEKMMKRGLETLEDQSKKCEKALRSIAEKEKKLRKRVAERNSRTSRNGTKSETLRLALEKNAGKWKEISYLKTAWQELVDEIRQRREEH